MKKKVVAILTMIVMLTAMGFVFVGCNTSKQYEAVIYNSTHWTLDEDFCKKNMTYGAYFENESGESVQDTTSPQTRTFVYTNQKDGEEVNASSGSVNFDKEILILYLFTDTHDQWRPYWLTDVSIKNRVLRIGIALHQVPFPEETIVPAWQRFIMVRMKKVNFESVEFYEVKENPNPKNAYLYDKAKSYMREDFLSANRTYGMYCEDGFKKYYDKTSPRTRTHVVTNQAAYDEIFSDFIAIDFEKEMLVVFVFTDRSIRHYRISDVELQDGKFQIKYYEQDVPTIIDAVGSYQRCFVLRMEKSALESIEFIELRNYYRIPY